MELAGEDLHNIELTILSVYSWASSILKLRNKDKCLSIRLFSVKQFYTHCTPNETIVMKTGFSDREELCKLMKMLNVLPV